jgi:Reverse transcriptase (RNA-dependent DNA polymerase)
MDERSKRNQSTREKDIWRRVVKLVQMVFTDQPIAQSFGAGMLVLIQKGVQDQYQCIALLEVIYKLVLAIINQRMSQEIQYHQAVHGFRQGYGTGTAIMEAKLRMQLVKRTTNSLCFTFLISKMRMTRTIQILKGYGIGRNVIHFIEKIWDMDTVVPKHSGFYGNQCRASRGVRQGDITSPIIFNIVTDAIIQECLNVFCGGNI